MALVSPGVELSIVDESQYLPSAVGTVPFVVIATAQNKLVNGVIASGTTKANALKVYGISSQRELAATFGVPVFRRSVNDTPLHGDELNEYGLMAAYSALGIGNRAWVVRADVDLDELVGTTVRPLGSVASGTNWLDIASTDWGIYEFDETIPVPGSPFVKKDPIVITNASDTLSGVPLSSVGNVGDFAINVINDSNFVFYKTTSNQWVALGSADWANDIPVVTTSKTTVSAGLAASPVAIGSTMTVNNVSVTFSSAASSMDDVSTVINSLSITGITTSVVNDRLVFKVEPTATSDGSTADGELVLVDGTSTPLTKIGITAGRYRRATVHYGGFAEMPLWRRQNTSTARPNHSVWVKTSAEGGGTNIVYKRYSAGSDTWTTLAARVYADGYKAIHGLDPGGGGAGISAGSVFAKYEPNNNGNVGYRIYTQRVRGVTKVTGSVTAPTFITGDRFTITASQPGTATPSTATATLGGTTAQSFVSAILAANVPNVTAVVETTGAISIIHKTGGIINLAHVNNMTGGGAGVASIALNTAGFVAGVTGVVANVVSGSINLTNWTTVPYTYSGVQPYTSPADGTMWYYNDPTAVDIMISDATGWKGYKNVSVDARGYDLSLTDPAGAIITATKPTEQSDGTALESGDLWLDTSDLEAYPKIYRYDKPSDIWSAVSNSDRLSQNGIVFADARWDSAGTADPVLSAYPSTVTLLSSDYLDLDAPDYRLYPRGTLLFNTRRSGYTVKKFINNYFSDASFPDTPTVPGSPSALPTMRDAWVSQLGFDADGNPLMGRHAQRYQVTSALKAAIDGNPALREEGYNYNLLTAPGYPELIPNLVALNNDRSQTGFVIGDTPVTLPATITELVNYSTTDATTASPFLAIYYPAALTNDLSGNEIAVPASHMMLRTYLYSDQVSYQWFAPAGTRRGLIDNAAAIGYVDANSGEFVRTGINRAIRDSMYENRLNPITLIPNIGIMAYGQKTRGPTGSAMDRVNVARLVNYLRAVLNSVANNFLFEPNDKITRDQLKQLVESLLNDLIAKRGIYDYLVVCDETNNTSARIARNELYVDVAIEPMKAVEFIYIPIRLRNPGTIGG